MGDTRGDTDAGERPHENGGRDGGTQLLRDPGSSRGVHSCLDLRLQPPELGLSPSLWPFVTEVPGHSSGSWERLAVITSHRFGAQGHVQVGLGIRPNQGEAGRKQCEPPSCSWK